jgi:hypothetical protein
MTKFHNHLAAPLTPDDTWRLRRIAQNIETLTPIESANRKYGALILIVLAALGCVALYVASLAGVLP